MLSSSHKQQELRSPDILLKLGLQGNSELLEASVRDKEELFMNIELHKLQNEKIYEGVCKYLKVQPSLIIDGTEVGRLGSPELKTIETLSKPSTYGQGVREKRVYDPKVRRAAEIEGKRIKFNFHTPKELLEMAPFGCQILSKLKLIKLAVYKEGDFFVEHVDAPRSSNHIGTLLVSLPTDHRGGNLVLRGNDNLYTWRTEENESDDLCQWIAFPTDFYHQVQPVKSGTRLVLQYQLEISPVSLPCIRKITDQLPQNLPKIQSDPEPKIQTLLSKIKEVFEKNPSLDYIALILSEIYGLLQLEPAHLTGIDTVLYSALQSVYTTSLKYIKISDFNDSKAGTSSSEEGEEEEDDQDEDEDEEEEEEKESERKRKVPLQQTIITTAYSNIQANSKEEDQLTEAEGQSTRNERPRKTYIVFGSRPKQSFLVPALFIAPTRTAAKMSHKRFNETNDDTHHVHRPDRSRFGEGKCD